MADWTLSRVLEHQAETISDRPFLRWTHDEDSLSFAETNKRANRIAHGLQTLGLRKGDRIILLLPNSLEYVLTWFAANKLGAIEVPINTAYKGSFLEHQINISGAETIVINRDHVEELRQSLDRLCHLKRCIVISGEVDRISSEQWDLGGLEVLAFEDLASGDGVNPGIEVLPQDLATIMFTSGTTGVSKGVLMSHAQIYLFSELDAQLVGLRSDDVYATGFPLFHANAQFLTLYPCLIVGALCVLYPRFSATEWLTQMIKSGATVTNSVGVVLPFVFNQPPTPLDKSHRLRCVCIAPMPNDLVTAFNERFGGIRFIEAFGQTEICLPLMTPYDVMAPRGACGVQVSQWFDVRIVDPGTDVEVPNGTVGELVIRSKYPWTINQGYSNMPKRTIEAFRNQWFHTGDAFRRDHEGWFYFVDRIKDALRRRGENISSFEVEEPIREHPAVLDVAVVGVPADVEGGEDEVMAYVVLKQGMHATPEELIEWWDRRVPYFAVPRFLEFIEELPKTPSEKVRKAALRDRGIGQGAWDRKRAGVRLMHERVEKRESQRG